MRNCGDATYKDREQNKERQRREWGIGMVNNQYDPIIPFLGIYPRDIIKDGREKIICNDALHRIKCNSESNENKLNFL